jgi:hypothetical protein
MSGCSVQPQNDSLGELYSFRRFRSCPTGVIQIFTFFPLQQAMHALSDGPFFPRARPFLLGVLLVMFLVMALIAIGILRV